jgi:predicted Fe-Mo cluster-binding NifX family protein
MKPVNPSDYNLSSRVVLRAVGENHIAIVKLIKSRIIQKDAAKIVEIARQIQRVDADMKVSLVCSSAICSKSLALLKNEGVGVIIEEL